MPSDTKIFETLDHFAANCEDFIFVVNRADRIEYCNLSALKLVGSEKREAALGWTYADLVPGGRDNAMAKSLKSVFESGRPIALENDAVLSDRQICLDVHLSPITNEDKTVRAVLGIARDITERSRRDRLTAHSRRGSLQAVDSMPYLLALVGLNHRIERLQRSRTESRCCFRIRCNRNLPGRTPA